MGVALEFWLNLIDKEYLRDFIANGGSAVKFVESQPDSLEAIQSRILALAERHGLASCRIDAAKSKLHMIQDVFFAISQSLDWTAMAQNFVEALVAKNGYEWPRPGHAVTFQDVAAFNEIAVPLLKRDLNHWLTDDIWHDRAMTQDFRAAMTQLCLTRLESAETDPIVNAPVVEWLRGELRAIGAVRQANITARITRHNGRATLRSLCRWLQLCGRNGLCVTIDVRQVLRARVPLGEGVRYSAAAVMDAFEVLRQLIDDAELFEGLFVVVLGDPSLTQGDPKRSLLAYDALNARVLDDVVSTERDNPLAALVRIEFEGPIDGRANVMDELPQVAARGAIEALRAGVPNRAAIRLLGEHNGALVNPFLDILGRCARELEAERQCEGTFVWGGFGSGKSHLLGYMRELALQRNFVVSVVPVSKETPMFDPGRLFAAAVRAAEVQGANDDLMTVALSRLKPTDSAVWSDEPRSTSEGCGDGAASGVADFVCGRADGGLPDVLPDGVHLGCLSASGAGVCMDGGGSADAVCAAGRGDTCLRAGSAGAGRTSTRSSPARPRSPRPSTWRRRGLRRLGLLAGVSRVAVDVLDDPLLQPLLHAPRVP